MSAAIPTRCAHVVFCMSNFIAERLAIATDRTDKTSSGLWCSMCKKMIDETIKKRRIRLFNIQAQRVAQAAQIPHAQAAQEVEIA